MAFYTLSLLGNKYMYVVFQASPVEIHVAYFVSVKIVMVGVTVYLWKYNIGCKGHKHGCSYKSYKIWFILPLQGKIRDYILTPVSIYVPGKMNYCRICYSTFPTLFTKQWYCIIFEKFHILWFYLNSGNKKNMPENFLYTIQEKVLIMLTKPICKQVSNFVTIIDFVPWNIYNHI